MCPVNIRPACEYTGKKNFNLRRMTDAEFRAPGIISREYWLSPKAAELARNYPEAILHNRLYDREEAGIVLYEKEDLPVCGIETRSSWDMEERSGIERVTVRAADECAGEKIGARVKLFDQYPSLFLPFDLRMVLSLVEKELKGGAQEYKSDEFPASIYRGSDPFDVYQSFQILVRHIRGKLAGIDNIVEIGSGLSTISFIMSLFLSKRCRITSFDHDPLLIIKALQIRKIMEKKYGYDFRAVSFKRMDMFSGEARKLMRRQDAAIGWFPISHRSSDPEVLSLLREMPEGAYFFQMYSTGRPLSILEDNRADGFEEVKVNSPEFFPMTVFRRV